MNFQEDKIVDMLVDMLGSVYCDTCAHALSENGCEECHRKMMGWGLASSYAQKIAAEIKRVCGE